METKRFGGPSRFVLASRNDANSNALVHDSETEACWWCAEAEGKHTDTYAPKFVLSKPEDRGQPHGYYVANIPSMKAMNDQVWKDACHESLASTVREALRHSPGELCSCMRDDAKAKHRGCYGVCEDAVDRVVSALEGKKP